MKFAVLGAAASVAVVPVTDWIHQVAGPAGDLAVVCTAAALFSALARRAWKGTRLAWDGIEEIRDNTAAVPTIEAKLDAHIDDTRARLDAIEQRRVRAGDILRDIEH